MNLNQTFRDHFLSGEELMNEEENDSMQKPFFAKEIEEDVMESNAHVAPGPYGLYFFFYQTF